MLEGTEHGEVLFYSSGSSFKAHRLKLLNVAKERPEFEPSGLEQLDAYI